MTGLIQLALASGWGTFLVLSLFTVDTGTAIRYGAASLLCAAACALIGRLKRAR